MSSLSEAAEDMLAERDLGDPDELLGERELR